MSRLVGFADVKYLEISASVSAALVEIRRFFWFDGLLDLSSSESLGFSRREVRKVISEKARSGTYKAFVSGKKRLVEIGEPTASSSYW